MAAVRELGTNFLADSFFITLFDILQGLIFSLLLLVFLTAFFSSTVNRSKTWFIFMGSVIEWCASYLLLIGQQIGNPPPVALCTFQSAGIYSSNPFVTSAAFALVFELFVKLKAALNRTGPLSVKWSWGLVIFPVCVYMIVFIWVIAVGISHPGLVEVDGTHMFCHIKVSQEIGLAQPFVVSATVTLLAEILVVIFSVWTNIILFNHKRKTGEFLSENSSPFSMSAFIRRNALMTALTTVGIIFATTSFVNSSDPNSPAWNLGLTAMPMCTFLLFGTRMDLLRVWFCLGIPPGHRTETSSV
ncbi:hypothetical protein ARMGADRAFT_1021693 [Armillaria gallica]|uniref:G-protein coupled receptors family 1 profile domain-containing protein n=1 Tax=Armillaria gallica TaxID=47427 RepID=A0A2H3C7T3_ARMGA|nr:hypothetical protein ARMGADRAFT_1021708 [Armillaria gallica]PBK79168.1 hypothetical protein ARMGADRAFT_1021693 [Armillaria gallica]